MHLGRVTPRYAGWKHPRTTARNSMRYGDYLLRKFKGFLDKKRSAPNPLIGWEIAQSGAWTWFNDPRAIVRNGILYSGHVRRDGAVCVKAWDMATRNGAESVLSSWRERDDHDNPGFLELADGRIAAFYSAHGSKQQIFMRFAKVGNPRTRRDWGPEIAVELPSRNFPGGVCYNNPFQLSDEPNRIYNFIRGVNWNPTVLISNDNGASWESPWHLISHADRPYAKFCSNGRDRIDVVYTDGHPRTTENSVYHLMIRNGLVCTTDGEPLGSLTDIGPVPTHSGSVVYRFGDAYEAGRAWVWDVAYDRTGNPVVVHTVKAGSADIRYFFATWSPADKRWNSREIAKAGANLYSSEEDYVGGITLDPDEPDRIYISSEYDPLSGSRTEVRELYRGTTTDAGRTWLWAPVTIGSTADNLRPYVPRNHGRNECLLWFTGRYRAYQDFETSIRVVVD